MAATVPSMDRMALLNPRIRRADWRAAIGTPLLYLLLLVGLVQAMALPRVFWLRDITGSPIYGSLALLLAQLAAGMLTFHWLRRHARRQQERDCGCGTGIGLLRSTRGWLLAGESGGLLLALGAAALASLLPRPAPGTAPMASLLLAMPVLPLAGTLVSVLLAPLFEEGVFRGALLCALAPAFGPLGAGVASTAVFTLLHVPEQAGYFWGLLPIACLGGFAAWLRVRSGSLWPGIAAHVCFNALIGFGALR